MYCQNFILELFYLEVSHTFSVFYFQLTQSKMDSNPAQADMIELNITKKGTVTFRNYNKTSISKIWFVTRRRHD